MKPGKNKSSKCTGAQSPFQVEKSGDHRSSKGDGRKDEKDRAGSDNLLFIYDFLVVLQGLIELVEPKAMFLDDQLMESWGIAASDTTIPVGSEKKSLVSRLLRKRASDSSLRGRVSGAARGSLPDAIDPAATAYVLFTSGTTSDPKGVCISQSALFAHVTTLSRLYELTPDSRILNTLILSHTDGVTQGPDGMRTALLESFRAKHVTKDVAVPFLLVDFFESLPEYNRLLRASVTERADTTPSLADRYRFFLLQGMSLP